MTVIGSMGSKTSNIEPPNKAAKNPTRIVPPKHLLYDLYTQNDHQTRLASLHNLKWVILTNNFISGYQNRLMFLLVRCAGWWVFSQFT